MMIKRDYLIILMLLIIILAIIIAIVSVTTVDDSPGTSKVSQTVLANDTVQDKGSVSVIKNIGNPKSKRIAYVVGVHPLENLTHKTLLRILPSMTNLNYCYDIYVINVTEDIGYYGDGSSDDSPGRQNGQNLALKYVYPEIADGDYELAVDIHSNVGAYSYKTFVFSPVNGSLGSEYAQDIAGECENISYYVPDSTTSGPYLTIPLNNNGVPAFYFEEYSFASQSEKDMHMMELINAVDNLNLDR